MFRQVRFFPWLLCLDMEIVNGLWCMGARVYGCMCVWVYGDMGIWGYGVGFIDVSLPAREYMMHLETTCQVSHVTCQVSHVTF